MNPIYCLTVLHVSILAALLFLTLDADGEASKCDIAFKESSNRDYDAILGRDFRIHCTVAFCNNSPPTVSWYKLEDTEYVPVPVYGHVKTEREHLNNSDLRSFLIFQKILRNNSGVYQCRGGGRVSCDITVYAIGDFRPYVYRVVGIMVFAILILTLCVASRCGCKGKSRDTPSRQPSHDALPATHIYDNDP